MKAFLALPIFLAAHISALLLGRLSDGMFRQFFGPVSQLERVFFTSGAMAAWLLVMLWTLQKGCRAQGWSYPFDFQKLTSLKGDKYWAALVIAIVPAAVSVSAMMSHYTEASAELRWQLVPVSLWCIASLALVEELIYRKILLGRLLAIANKNTYWCVAALAFQGSIFSLMHGGIALISKNHFLFYAMGGCLLGWLFWTYQNIWLNTLTHVIMNVSTAQAGPLRHWFAGRLAQFAGDAWHDWFVIGAACLLGVQLLTLPFRNKKGRDTSRPWYEEARG